jgi:hypothetical protein
LIKILSLPVDIKVMAEFIKKNDTLETLSITYKTNDYINVSLLILALTQNRTLRVLGIRGYKICYNKDIDLSKYVCIA